MDSSELERLLNSLTEEQKANILRFFAAKLPKSEDPEDAVAELLTRVFESIATLENDAAFWGWFWSIAERVAADLKRGRRRRKKHVELAGESFEEEATEPEGREAAAPARTQEQERQDRVRKAISELPEEERKAIELKIYSGLQQTEIATALGWPLSKVKNRLRTAYEALGKKLDGLDL